MTVVIIDDRGDKRGRLGATLQRACGIQLKKVRDKADLLVFMDDPGEPGIAVIDGIDFHGLGKAELQQCGRELASKGWTVISWSTGLSVDDVYEDFHLENDDGADGAQRIAEAIGTNFKTCGLKRGRKLIRGDA